MKFSKKVASFIVDSRWLLFGIFIILAVLCVFLTPQVKVNYDMTKYLPESSSTRIGITVMEEEFGSSGTASIMLYHQNGDAINIEDVTAVKSNIQKLEGVATVVFDAESSEYYKNGKALLQVFFTTGSYDVNTSTTLNQIKAICENYNTAMAGQAIDGTSGRDALGTEVVIILALAIVIVLGILTLTSRSWLEPLVYLIVIGIAILINMGSNLLLGEISFITQSISTIMLIALEMDYCIVLCSRFREEESKGKNSIEAMKDALANSFTAIIASSLTVIAGLVALMFMQYSIGFDIGAVLAKGVFISILAVILFMPSAILMFSKLLDRTKHKSFIPKMDKIAHCSFKARWVLPIVFVLIIGGAYVLQTSTAFSYVNQSAKEGSAVDLDKTAIAETFGQQNSLVVLVPNDDIDKEKALFNSLCTVTIDIDGTPTSYITNKKGIAGTALYSELTPSIITSYGLDDSSAYMLMQAIKQNKEQKLGVDVTKLYIFDMIIFLNENPALLSVLSLAKQAKIDTIYSSYSQIKDNKFYEMLTLSKALEAYPDVDSLVITSIYTALIPSTRISTTPLPNYVILSALVQYGIGDYPANYGMLLLEPCTQLTKTEVMTNFSLPSEAVDAIFLTYGIDTSDKILKCQVIQALNHRDENGITVLGAISTETQKQIENAYNEGYKNFVSEHYSRMIFNLNVELDSENAKAYIIKIKEILNASGYENYYIVNETDNLIETAGIFKTDKLQTDLIAVVGILLIVLLAFRSLSLPIILVLTIQGSIWINMSFSVLTGSSVFFVCYLLGMAIQMGATIDYGILLSDRYKNFRRENGRLDSMKMALNTSLPTILTSGSILIIAPFLIHFISSMPVVSEIGLLVGRGALISVIAILFILPSSLMLFDKFIEKTTLKTKFFKEVKPVKTKTKK